ncbi:hypothetical protein KUCAC02_033392 [Chaenocephalus aceratus]|nr:hypothetical protein KUCAC02_033392 [Chaenocephalus aceratus]
MGNYRTKLRNIGCSELTVNSLKRQQDDQRTSRNQVKKPKRAEVVKDKMERTFAYRRHEVIEDKPFIAEFKRRWLALFSEREVEAEFARITTVPLRSKFMQQLDHHSSKLLRIFQKKGGVAGQKIRNIMAEYDKNDAIETRRACVIKALIVYLNEDPESLIREYLDVETDQCVDEMVLGIFAIKKEE